MNYQTYFDAEMCKTQCDGMGATCTAFAYRPGGADVEHREQRCLLYSGGPYTTRNKQTDNSGLKAKCWAKELKEILIGSSAANTRTVTTDEALKDCPKWIAKEATTDPKHGQFKSKAGKCLDASQRDMDGGKVHMWDCDVNNQNQQWTYTGENGASSGLLKAQYGRCLDASERNKEGGKVHIWSCNSANQNQIWSYDTSKNGQMKATHGICLDASERNKVGGKVHMWTCDTNNANQQWEYSGTTSQTFTKWMGTDTYPDQFKITTSGKQVTAQRLDAPGGWGMDLKIACTK